jgi:glutathione S-transferase
LRRTGQPFREIVVPLYIPGYKELLLKHSPAGKVPVLRHGRRVIWDSLAICEYLAEQFPQSELWPQDGDARAVARSISAEMHSGFAAIRQAMPFNCRATGRRLAAYSAELLAELDRVQEIWRDARSRFGGNGPWLFGQFCIADAMFAPVALRFVTYGPQLDEVAQAYVAAVQAHPPVQEWIKAAELEVEIIRSSEVGEVGAP